MYGTFGKYFDMTGAPKQYLVEPLKGLGKKHYGVPQVEHFVFYVKEQNLLVQLLFLSSSIDK